VGDDADDVMAHIACEERSDPSETNPDCRSIEKILLHLCGLAPNDQACPNGGPIKGEDDDLMQSLNTLEAEEEGSRESTRIYTCVSGRSKPPHGWTNLNVGGSWMEGEHVGKCWWPYTHSFRTFRLFGDNTLTVWR
jgi:hypothetical protein